MKNTMGNIVLVIGGGAAGITAAIAARRAGARVILLEKGQRVGRKILATGNGRCNLTNERIDISFYHGLHPEFIYGAFSRFDYHSTIDFFEDLGIYPVIEEGGKVFPASFQASSVLDVLRYEMETIGVEVVCDANVRAVRKKKGFEVILEDGKSYRGDRVVIATGGKASPDLGSNGSGYELAKALGHKIVEPFPALVQLKLKAKFLKQIQGVKFNGIAEVIFEGKTIRREAGEILFTEYGISGPPILQLSRKAAEILQGQGRPQLKVTVIEHLNFQELDELLAARFLRGREKQLSFSFVGLLNKRIIPVILKEAGIEDINKPCYSVTLQERKSIAHILKDWRFEILGTQPWSSAQVTAGGVDVRDVDSKTMESKIIKGLYFAGEILDIDGDCGGYNLQWAWSSGYVAGESAALSQEK